MALQTSKSISVDNFLFKLNNQILEFYDDDNALTPTYAEISIDGITDVIRIYPNTDGKFWFNFKKHFNVLLPDLEDDINPVVDINDIDSFVFDWSKSIKNPTITYKIFFANLQEVEGSFAPYVVNGVEDLYNFKIGETQTSTKVILLSSVMAKSNNHYYLKYWHGYPFDFGLSRALPNLIASQTIKNRSNGIETDPISTPHIAQRIFISNGDTTQDIEDFLPLQFGYNELEIYETANSSLFIELNKLDGGCGGVYLKWFNKSGGYNYWLFNEMHEETIRTNERGFIDNDYSELDNTVSPKKSLGRDSEEQWKLKAQDLTSDDMRLLKSLFDSPAVFLFTGKPFAQNSDKDWVEVLISSHSYNPRDWKGRIEDQIFTIKLQDRKTIFR